MQSWLPLSQKDMSCVVASQLDCTAYELLSS